MPESAVSKIRTHSSIHRVVDSPLNQTRQAGRHTESSDTSKQPPWVCTMRPAADVLLADLRFQETGKAGEMENPDAVMLYLEHFF